MNIMFTRFLTYENKLNRVYYELSNIQMMIKYLNYREVSNFDTILIKLPTLLQAQVRRI